MTDSGFAPLYFKLKKEIIDMIESGEIKPDEPIPSEPKLMQMYGLSRTTVRKALDILVNEGYLYRVHGKGTFVKGKGFTQGLIALTSCREDILKQGLTPGVRVLCSLCVPAGKRISALLKIGEEDLVLHLRRVMYGDNIPVNVTSSYMPYSIVSGIDKRHDFAEESLYNVLERELKIRILGAKRIIEAQIADEEIAGILQMNPGDPVLKFNGLVSGVVNNVERPIEYFEATYQSDRWKFYIEQFR